MIVNAQRNIPVAVVPLAEFFERARVALKFPENCVTIRLISDTAMGRLNQSFRGKRGPTDVLSFPADAPPEKPTRNRRAAHTTSAASATAQDSATSSIYIGDIAISPQTASRNARRYSRGLPAELRVLILHGMIHLAGYDHETDHGEMERLERRLRRKLGLQC